MIYSFHAPTKELAREGINHRGHRGHRGNTNGISLCRATPPTKNVAREVFNHRGHRGNTKGISWCPLCPLCPLWLAPFRSLPSLRSQIGQAVATFFLCFFFAQVSLFSQLHAEETALPPALPPTAPAKDSAAWLMPLLSVSRELARTRPEVVDADISRNSAALSTRVAQSQWNPRASLSPSFGEGRSQSNSVVDGSGIIRAQNGSTSLSFTQPFSTGTAVSLSGASSASRSDGANVISDSFYSSSVSLAISQNLLRGNSRELNRAGILDANEAELDAHDQFDSTLEGQLADLATRWLTVAQAEASLEQRREDVRISAENLRQFDERLRVGLSRELDVLSLRRGVADQEVQLAKDERRYAAELRQLALYWPDLVLPERASLLKIAAPAIPAPPSFATTRLGRATLRSLAAAARRVAVAQNNAYDDLSVDTSISKYGTDGDLGGSWSRLDNRQTYDWRVGLSYSHTFGTEANRVAHHQALLSLEKAHLRARIAERDWHATSLQLHDIFEDAIARVGEQERLVAAQRDELVLATAQVEAGKVTTRDLVDAQQRVSDAVLALYQANLDVLRADLQLRLHENRLLGLLP